jgi:pimeloyl-ACP methyl ester carboxylesterase
MVKEKKYTEGFVESDKVKLHYIDWGGDGQVLVLLSGWGDTPYVFDSLAKQLSASFRIIGYSRRNHGKSISKIEKYDNESLVYDLKLLLDSLKIMRANLLGWSMGGNEITEFAALFPDRVNKLIYFEAGYDLSDGGFEKLVSNVPQSYLPDSSIMKSLDNYRKWYHRFWFGDVEWNDALESNLLASVEIRDDGSVECIPNDYRLKAILREAISYRRRYEEVQSPSLVVYANPYFHPAEDKPATLELYDNLEKNIVAPWRAANRKRIKKELRNSTIVEAPNGTHTSLLFLSHDFLVNAITSFLAQGK